MKILIALLLLLTSACSDDLIDRQHQTTTTVDMEEAWNDLFDELIDEANEAVPTLRFLTRYEALDLLSEGRSSVLNDSRDPEAWGTVSLMAAGLHSWSTRNCRDAMISTELLAMTAIALVLSIDDSGLDVDLLDGAFTGFEIIESDVRSC